jgi:hypothetical protein
MKENDIIIRFAVRDDVDKIMKAFENYWEADHILAHNKDFFLYLFAGTGNEINMVIAEKQSTGEIAGFLGFVKYSADVCCDIYSNFWRIFNSEDSILGLELLGFLDSKIKPKFNIGLGLIPNVIPILKKIKTHVGKMEHYYRISDRDEYKIAVITDKRILPVTDSPWNLIPVPSFDFFKTNLDNSILNEVHPYKDINFYCHRYFNHPVHQYKVYAIVKENEKPAFLVCREVKKFGVKILRVVDYIGKEIYFGYLSSSLQKLMDENNYEYIDCYCIGMSAQIMNNAGFIQRNETDENIIPNYFEPFICKNVDIFYSTNIIEGLRLFRGDGYQDHPRMYDRSLC